MSIPLYGDRGDLGFLPPQAEPEQVIAGDAVSWRRRFEVYPASSGLSLSYTLINRTATYAVAGDQVAIEDDDYVVSIPSAVTALWMAGVYRWQAYLTDTSGNRRTISEGEVEVLPNLQVQPAGMDDREPDEKILDAIKDLIAGKVLAGDAQRYIIHGRELQRYTFAELQKLRGQYERRVRAIRIRRGEIVPRRSIGVFFGGF